MPFYEYECPHCRYYLEVMQKIADAPLKKCPSCGKSGFKRLISAPVFRLKGKGWYETDFKSDKENKRNLVGNDPEPKAASEAKPDTKTEAKSESKAEGKAEGKADAKPEAKSESKESGAKPAATPSASRKLSRRGSARRPTASARSKRKARR
jgi:putative FmdB family regulatory protein